MTVRLRDWKAFWASLTPLEIFEALDAAPNVAGPWEEIDDVNARRTRVHDLAAYQDVGDERVTIPGHGLLPGAENIEFRSCDVADEALRAAGWLLAEDDGDDDDGEGDIKPKLDLERLVANNSNVLQAGVRLVDDLVRAQLVAIATPTSKQNPS